jgi:hypothetical protein
MKIPDFQARANEKKIFWWRSTKYALLSKAKIDVKKAKSKALK